MYTGLEESTQPPRFLHFAVYQDAKARDEHTSEPAHNRVKALIAGYIVTPPGFVATEYSVVANQTVFSK